MYDIGIIGAGPAGYVAAIRAAQKGLTVVLFEKDEIGGTCLNRGCIPTKTILHSCKEYNAIKNAYKFGITAENIKFDFEKIQERQKTISEKIRKNLTLLIKSYNIEIVQQKAFIDDEHHIKTEIGVFEVNNIIIATGSKPNKIHIDGTYSNDFVMTSDDVLNLKELPQSILIIGSGAIGVEWARIFSALGTKVTVVEMMKNLLPNADYEVSERLVRLFKKARIEFYTDCHVEKIEGNKVYISNGKIIETDKVLLGAGRLPETEIGKISTKLELNKFININNNFMTNIANIYAIGDINGISMLAHSASRQAEDVIDYIITGKQSEFNKTPIPSVVYGVPEIAQIGKTEQQLIKEHIIYKKSIFPISALGKAYADDKIEGFVKILTDNQNKIIGAHIIAEEASAMIEQIAVAMTNNLTADDMRKTVYAHPTYSEAVFESLLALDNIAIHIPQEK